MVFSSIAFIYVFLPIALLLYYITPKKLKNLTIFATGLFFYAWGEPVYVVVMIISAYIDYFAGLMLHKDDHLPKKRVFWLILSLVMNLGLLGVFKYSSFMVMNFNDLFGLEIKDPHLPLPIGISFYTFQSMSYTIDRFLRNVKVQRNFINFAAYITMFPQIIAGPIVRYTDVEDEIETRKTSLTTFGEGVGIFTSGLAKKVLLANNIGLLWDVVKATPIQELSVLSAWLGILAFTFQIYFDFSGYSDMAIGLGRMFGFHFPINFNYPYISKSITEFWRRWHITLGTWFRCYVYIPLGGNRGNQVKTVRNLLIVWMLTGLWHGASWNFIIWGLYFGVIIIAERLFLLTFLEKLPNIMQWFYAFLLAVIGWVIFEIEDVSQIGQYILTLFGFGGNKIVDSNALYLLVSYWVIFVLCALAATEWPKKLALKLYNQFPVVIAILNPVYDLALFFICTAYLVNSTYNPFLYFRF